MTFQNWADRWLNCYKKGTVKLSTYKETYERTIESYLNPYFGDFELESIKPIEIRHFFNLQADKYHLTTIKKMRLCLNGIFETAIENDLCVKNPVKNIKINSNLESKIRRTYSLTEVNEILKLSDLHKYGIYIRALLELGLRCSELCGLKWSDIDFERMTISVDRACTELGGKAVLAKPKNKSSKRTLPISTKLCERLKINRPKSDDEFLLKSRKGKLALPVTPSSFAECRYKTFSKI